MYFLSIKVSSGGHDRSDLLRVVNVLQWVTFEKNEISRLPHFYRAGLCFLVKICRWIEGGGL
jgi:hypothetical protein